MKKILFIALVLVTLFSCKEDEKPYFGYASFEDYKSSNIIIIDKDAGSHTINLFTDQDAGILVPVEGSEWCSGSVNNGVITLTCEANTGDVSREGTVDIYIGYHHLTLNVVQRSAGVNHIEIPNPDEKSPLRWSATCSDVQESDGGGLNSIFKYDQTSFWHSSYSPHVDLPHWIVVDLKEEMDINQVRLGWRMNGANVYIHVRKVEILVSNDGVNFTPTGGEIFREPVDGKLSSPNYPPYTNCAFNTVKARYVKLNMTESNASNGVCHVAYFRVYMP